MLKVQNLRYQRGELFCLAVPLLAVTAGEKITILGSSGSGKSTLIRLIAGLEKADEGEIYLNQQLLNTKPAYQRKVSLLAQEFGLWPHLTALEHLAFSRTQGKNLRHTQSDLDLLAWVHLQHRQNARPNCMSGGEQQRLALARALVRQPELLLLDEPFSNVDPVLAAELEALLDEVHLKWNMTRIQVRHWMRHAAVDERFLIMDAGRIIQEGAWEALCQNPINEWVKRYTQLNA